MKTGINIQGASPERDTIKAVSEAVMAIFKAGHDTHMEQDTIQTALNTLSKVSDVSASVNSSSIDGGKTINVYTGKEEEL